MRGRLTVQLVESSFALRYFVLFIVRVQSILLTAGRDELPILGVGHL